jgi:hypothetical protein
MVSDLIRGPVRVKKRRRIPPAFINRLLAITALPLAARKIVRNYQP